MSCDYHLLPHEGIQSLAPYVPGKSAEELAVEQGLSNIIKLASNENPRGCSPLVPDALSKLSGHQIATYCTSRNHALRPKLAHHLSVDQDMLILANGSDTLFSLLLICFALHRDKHVLTHDYAFITYGIQAKTLGIPLVSTPLNHNWQVDIDAMITACSEKTALIFIANPNNPTGLPVERSELIRLLDNIPESTLLVLDEAYYEYADLAESCGLIDKLQTYPNLVITRTFSKAYGLAGLRLGYAIATASIIALLHRIQLPFIVSLATLEAGSAALDDQPFIKRTKEKNAQGRIHLSEGLTALGIDYLPSEGNFITFDCKKDALPLYDALQQQGIIVRPLHPYGLTHFLRVTIGTTLQMDRFLDTLSHCMVSLKELPRDE